MKSTDLSPALYHPIPRGPGTDVQSSNSGLLVAQRHASLLLARAKPEALTP